MDELVYPKERTLGSITLILGLVGWVVLIVGTLGGGLLYVLLSFIGYVFAQSAWVAHTRGTAVRITSDQFPDLYQRLKACCKTLGVAKVPEAYILHGNGVFNAFAARFFGRHFLVVFSDIADALEEDPQALNFYLGHELGHIRLGHLTGQLWRMPALWLPLLGAAYSRAREYSCDRHGRACCGADESAGRALVALGAGARRWSTVNLGQYVRQGQANTGFWPSFHELTGGYPYLTKRVAAVVAPSEPAPKRNPLAYLLALFVPYAGRAGAGIASLMVVVALIGVLAAVALPAYQDYTTRAKVAEAVGALSGVRAALANRVAKNPTAGLLTAEEVATIKAAGAATGADGVDTYATERYADAIYSIHVPRAEGHVYVYTRDAGQTWACGSTDVPTKFLPASCRDQGGLNRPAPPAPPAPPTPMIGQWEKEFAQGTYNGCVQSRSKSDPEGAPGFCKCVVYKLADTVPQEDMAQQTLSPETRQAVSAASQACLKP